MPTRVEAEIRYAKHYLTALRAADERYRQSSESPARDLSTFDQEWPSIQKGQARAAGRLEDDDMASLCNLYFEAGINLLSVQLHPKEYIPWLDSSLAAARRLNDRSAEAKVLGTLGRAFTASGENSRAVENYEQALMISRELADRQLEAGLLSNLGLLYFELGRRRCALKLQAQAFEISRERGDRRAAANALGNLGIVFMASGKARKAI